MMSIREIIKNGKCQDLHTVVNQGGAKYIIFTRCEADIFILCVSDGYDVWRLEADNDEMETLRELSELNMDAYLTKLRNGFSTKNITIEQTGIKIELSIGSGTKINFTLYEAKAVDKKTELQGLVFRLAEKSLDLEGKLEKASGQIESLQNQKGSNAATGIGGAFDIAAVDKKQKTMPKKVGMSVINPGSRKRKAPRGVEFD